MPVLTDPRQIVSPLPASLIKEVLDGFPSDSSAKERSVKTEREPQLAGDGTPTRNVETKAGKQPNSIPGASAPTEGKPRRDQLYREKRLVECWGLNASKEFRGELEPMTPETKELILQEAILWHAREQESEKWKAFQP